ncbi:dethiobiotin synthase [Sphingobacterium kyonggiense]
MHKQFFLTGIGTGVGKTISSAFLLKLWDAAYWKPVQSGDLQSSDTQCVKELLGDRLLVFPEQYRLHKAASPHESAAEEGIKIDLEAFKLPSYEGNLLVEGAGGLFVPLSEDLFILDLMKRLNLPIVLVCRDYLGCINHSLLSIKAIQNVGLELSFLVFNGPFNPASERIIRKQIPVSTKLIYLPELEQLTAEELTKAMPFIRIEELD